MGRWDEQGYLRLIRGETRGVSASAARLGLLLASGPYGWAVAARNSGYDRGWTRVERAGIPVVSVGNLTVGGTGKTPMVEWAARRLRSRGLRVALLSRGYGGGTGLNDEGRVLDENLPDVPHLQDADRVALARIAVEELESEVLVLDDGFQHRRLGRDLDIVLIDALDPIGGGHLTPRGLLREPLGSLRRADVVVLSRADLVDEEGRRAIRETAERRARKRLEWAEARHAPRDLLEAGGLVSALGTLKEARVLAFCGIGNPEGFRRTLDGMGVRPVEFRIFADHHDYARADVDELAATAARVGADLVLTTQKDLVKLRVSALGAVPLRAVRIGLEFLTGEARVEAALERVIEK